MFLHIFSIYKKFCPFFFFGETVETCWLKTNILKPVTLTQMMTLLAYLKYLKLKRCSVTMESDRQLYLQTFLLILFFFSFLKCTTSKFSKEKYKDTNHPMNLAMVWQQQSSSQQKCMLKLFSKILLVKVEKVFYPYFGKLQNKWQHKIAALKASINQNQSLIRIYTYLYILLQEWRPLTVYLIKSSHIASSEVYFQHVVNVPFTLQITLKIQGC